MLTILGYICSALIGISLGLIGGGGSILTVPVLVYLFQVEPVTATAYSLFIVGITSLTGAIPRIREGLVDVRTAVIFGIPSILVVSLTRHYIIPGIPEIVLSIGGFDLNRGIFLLTLFAILMVGASISMMNTGWFLPPGKKEIPRRNYKILVIEGMVVGLLTGLVGAGGGFLIIPALVLFSGIPMKKAVGTTLLIIAANSLTGFVGDIFRYPMNWTLLLSVSAIAIAGIFIGNRITKRVEQDQLRKGFSWFVLITGIYILVRELLFVS